jgi:hypothetical protein
MLAFFYFFYFNGFNSVLFCFVYFGWVGFAEVVVPVCFVSRLMQDEGRLLSFALCGFLPFNGGSERVILVPCVGASRDAHWGGLGAGMWVQSTKDVLICMYMYAGCWSSGRPSSMMALRRRLRCLLFAGQRLLVGCMLSAMVPTGGTELDGRPAGGLCPIVMYVLCPDVLCMPTAPSVALADILAVPRRRRHGQGPTASPPAANGRSVAALARVSPHRSPPAFALRCCYLHLARPPSLTTVVIYHAVAPLAPASHAPLRSPSIILSQHAHLWPSNHLRSCSQHIPNQ